MDLNGRGYQREVERIQDQITENYQEVKNRAQEFVREYPLVAVAGTFAVGYLLGKLFFWSRDED